MNVALFVYIHRKALSNSSHRFQHIDDTSFIYVYSHRPLANTFILLLTNLGDKSICSYNCHMIRYVSFKTCVL